jgi:hypothetical protein
MTMVPTGCSLSGHAQLNGSLPARLLISGTGSLHAWLHGVSLFGFESEAAVDLTPAESAGVKSPRRRQVLSRHAAECVTLTVDVLTLSPALLPAHFVFAVRRFASTHQGKYQVAVPDAGAFYPSSNWMDDVAFNALWLHLASGEAKYKAEGLAWYLKHYSQEDGKGVWHNYDWDSNSWGAALLLTRCTISSHKSHYKLQHSVLSWAASCQ